jgi:hypothetical protein
MFIELLLLFKISGTGKDKAYRMPDFPKYVTD